MTPYDSYLTSREKRLIITISEDIGSLRKTALALRISPTTLYRYLSGEMRVAPSTRASMNYRLQQRGFEPVFASITEPEISEWFETIGLLQQKRKKQESQK